MGIWETIIEDKINKETHQYWAPSWPPPTCCLFFALTSLIIIITLLCMEAVAYPCLKQNGNSNTNLQYYKTFYLPNCCMWAAYHNHTFMITPAFSYPSSLIWNSRRKHSKQREWGVGQGENGEWRSMQNLLQILLHGVKATLDFQTCLWQPTQPTCRKRVVLLWHTQIICSWHSHCPFPTVWYNSTVGGEMKRGQG